MTKKRFVFLLVNVLLILLALGLLLTARSVAAELQSQSEDERWRGESELEFRQISCFLQVNEKVTSNDINSFRYKIDTKIKEAVPDATEKQLFADAWSVSGKLKIASGRADAEVSALAVGGAFFQFHPMTLLGGNYIAENDLMKDRVVLDEETAWLLFGSNQIQGMSVDINGVPFSVAGVVEREQDPASKKAYTAGMGVFLSYEGYCRLYDEEPGIDCYEIVLPEPVKGFAREQVAAAFPIGGGDVVENSGRFAYLSSLRTIGNLGTLSMQTMGVAYPYWENAARYNETRCALLYLAVTILLLTPAVTALVFAIKALLRGKAALEEKAIPQLKEKTAEAIRSRQRAAWEKRRKKYKH